MFAWWGRTVYQYRYIVIGVMVALCLGGGVYGISLGQHVTQSGFYDEGSESVHASVVSDKVYGRDTSGHIVAIYTAPDGKTVDDPAFKKKILDNLNEVEKNHPDQILRAIGYFKSPEVLKNMADGDKKHAFMSVQLKGDNDDVILNNYNKNVGEDGKTVKEALNIDGIEVQQAGLQPLASELTGTIGEDQRRAEIAAIPLVCVAGLPICSIRTATITAIWLLTAPLPKMNSASARSGLPWRFCSSPRCCNWRLWP